VFKFVKIPHRRLVTLCSCEWIRPMVTSSNTWFLGPTNGISMGSAVFPGRDRHTDHATPSVVICRMLCSECMRCGLVIIYSFLSNHKIVTSEAVSGFVRQIKYVSCAKFRVCKWWLR